MDEKYLLACVKYIENNPVRAGIKAKPEEWRWSSARAHINGKNDELVIVKPLLDIVGGKWSDFLSEKMSSAEVEELRKHERTGRPIGRKSFIQRLEELLGRKLLPKKPGRKSKSVK
jgi:putative transposase